MTIAGSHVSGLLMQPFFTTVGLVVVREVGPDQGHGLDTRDPKKVLPPRRRPINIMPSAPPQPVTLTACSSCSGVAIVRCRCGDQPIAKPSYPATAHACTRYWGAR